MTFTERNNTSGSDDESPHGPNPHLKSQLHREKGQESIVSHASDRPLTPRSLALSVLLGSHPPVLPTRAFVRLAEEFGMAPGTMRTALSRLVAAGDLDLDDGRYRLGSTFDSRQRSQDVARVDVAGDWDGTWHTVVTVDDQRSQAARRRFRTTMTDAHFGELRADIWMRPANLPAPPADGAWLCTTGSIDGADPADLVGRLWPVDEIGRDAAKLIDDLVQVGRSDARATIPERFTTAAAALRLLRRDPLLPAPLTPPRWPLAELRRVYALAETDLQTRLRDLFRTE